MTTTAKNVLIALVTATVIAACARTAPVYNVSAMPVMANKPTVSLDEVGQAIIRAGATLGWQIRKVKPGLMLGTLHLRDHTALVDITYDPTSYSITYKNSTNLHYDGKVIHKNYNGWIQNLDRAIKVQLSAI